jgi:hypothetical protein
MNIAKLKIRLIFIFFILKMWIFRILIELNKIINKYINGGQYLK